MKTEKKIAMTIGGERDCFYQWDSGQRLIIDDAGTCNEVHFTNSERTDALVCRVWEEKGQRYVNVPNVLLQCAKMIRVYAHTATEYEAHTNHYQTFEVKERNKPEDYVYTETEVLSYKKMEERIAALEQADNVDAEAIEEGIQAYLQKNPITPESIDALPADQLPNAVNDALARAKASGDFRGEPGEKGEKGDKGDQGIQGEQGPAGIAGLPGMNGYTPVKGVDYYTDEDKNDFRNFIAQEIAGRSQLKPLFVNTVEECVDIDSVYILPDGYVYAYMDVATVGYKNMVPTSVEINNTDVYNAPLGYKENTYISSSSGGDSSKTGHVTTGLIPYTVKASTTPETIYVKGGTPDRIAYYLSNKTYKLCVNQVAPVVFSIEQLGADYWKLIPIMTANGNPLLYENQGAGGYLRFDCICSNGTNLVITLDEEISEDMKTSSQWINTGCAFVPADYEDRIISLEICTDNCKNRLSELERKDNDIPLYVCREAERVADLVLDKRNAQCLCFAALSDIHYPYDNAVDNTSTEQALQHAAMGLLRIRKFVLLDFVGLFGDYVRGHQIPLLLRAKLR